MKCAILWLSATLFHSNTSDVFCHQNYRFVCASFWQEISFHVKAHIAVRLVAAIFHMSLLFGKELCSIHRGSSPSVSTGAVLADALCILNDAAVDSVRRSSWRGMVYGKLSLSVVK